MLNATRSSAGSLPPSGMCARRSHLRAVYGNIDDKNVRSEFPLDNKFTIEGVSVWITHIGGYPHRYNPRIKESIVLRPPKLFISGHSHILKVQYDKKLKLLHMNPGGLVNMVFIMCEPCCALKLKILILKIWRLSK